MTVEASVFIEDKSSSSVKLANLALILTSLNAFSSYKQPMLSGSIFI